MSAPLILSVVGKSDSGKTTLILKLLPELKKRRYRVAVAKYCPHGFDLDIEGKDSWKFTQAGAEGILLTSVGSFALLRPKEDSLSMRERLQNYFSDVDIVLMEGYNNEPGIEKIEIIRREIGKMGSDIDGVIAYVSDMHLETERRVFGPDDISAVADFIETLRQNPPNPLY